MSGSESEKSDSSTNSDEISESSSVYAAQFFINVLNYNPSVPRFPKKNSILQGSDWCGELLWSNSTRFYAQARMTKACFFELVHTLGRPGLLVESPQSHVCIIERVLMFIRIVCTHHRHRDEEERFQHSTETVNFYFYKVLEALLKLGEQLIKAPDYNHIPLVILNNSNFMPYFEGAIGALDGTLIPAYIPAKRANAWRSRKGTKSQNVLAIVSFDLMFKYVYACWEGSAHDVRVLSAAIYREGTLPWPPVGRYYLADAGYTNYKVFMVPFRNRRYNLPEFNGRIAPQNAEELFNHRHSQLRNVVERAFGALKSRFRILAYGMPSFKIGTQPEIVVAYCFMHNFIRQTNLADHIFEEDVEHYTVDDLIFSGPVFPTDHNIADAGARRLEIVQAMWQDFNG